ncbi:MAG TPA: S8 family serine peptidase [Candidatus Bathyarchaeia archaeon]|nr:S8 family serine peptidase [Candidatus Bathyarchaeia archaeon]
MVPLCREEALAHNSDPNSILQDDSFKPAVWKPTWIDSDNNGIADSLDQEITERIANGTARDYINVTVMLEATPAPQDANDFVSCGGYLTTSAWTKATYGFGGMIPFDGIPKFVQKCPNVMLVEKEAIGKSSIAYAAQQVGARTYVWNDLGLQGDPNSSTAIVDTGIDGSHVDFSPGYGDKDFSKKIVGWDDEIGSTTFPVDDNGHGSHVAGLSSGDGFSSVDASGNAVATWGSNLESVSSSGTYLISSMMVNKTGAITVNVKWARTGTAGLSALVLAYGDKTLTGASWTQVASVSTPSQNTFYSLTYNVTTTPSGGYDMYHIMLTMTAGTGNLYVAFNLSWPYTPPSDGFSSWTGIAPQSKLVGVKVMNSLGSGTGNALINGINWIIANRVTYHITVASMSLGFTSEVASVDSTVVNLVNSGVTVVVAAGNSGSGSNRIYSCGSVDEVITVAAINQFDSVAGYSSQGGTSRYTGKTTKPDITSPGGSFLAVPLFSTDSNYNDGEGRFSEIQPNDSTPLQGTSMATPIISGCVQIVIQAMGGFAKWNWTKNQALQPKMLLLMTATETYPNFREANSSSASPTLDRGVKDVHEGYGRVNLDAAVDAVLKSYGIGSVITDTLGRPPTLMDISVLGQKLAWARNIQLVSGTDYNFNLSVPAGADFDLYLYNSIGTTYGEPTIVARSTNATKGGTEQFFFKAPSTGTFYIVVKRATENTGSGTFTLASSGPNVVTITLNTPGLQVASNVVHYTQNGAAKNGSIVANRFSANVDPQTTLAIDSPIYVSATQRYITTDSTSFSVQSSANFTVNYQAQYYISVNSSHGFPTASQWVDQGGSFIASVASPTEIVEGDHKWVCTGFSIDGGSSQVGTAYTFTNVQASHTLSFGWKEQFYLTVSSVYGTTSGGGWFDSDATTAAAVLSGTVSGGTGVQYVFTGWSSDAAGTGLFSDAIKMNGPKTARANWITQYYLTESTNFGSVSPNSGWHDAGSTITISASAPSAGSGERYVWNNWTGAGSSNYTGVDVLFSLTMNGPVDEAASWTHQYELTVTSPYGSPWPTSGWFDAGTSIQVSVTSPVAGSVVTQFACSGWIGTGSVPASGVRNKTFFTINQPSSIAWSWETQYLPVPLIGIMAVLVDLVGSAVYLLLRRRRKQKLTQGII